MVLDGTSSQEYPVNAAVPEGSILGPTLFLLSRLEIIIFQWLDMLSDYARIYVGHFSFKSVN